MKNYKYKAIRSGFLVIAALCLSGAANGQTASMDTIPDHSNRAIAYDKQETWRIAGSLSTIAGDDLRTSFTSNVANRLNGRIPGLVVQQNGSEPGLDAPGMNMRGISTFTGSNDLYYVIDGFPSTSTMFQQLTAEEIESITLLKDAASTAIYGNKGANGVLLITTKHGMKSPMRVEFSAQYGFQQATRLPKFLGSYDYARMFNEALANDGMEAAYLPEDLEMYRSGGNIIRYPDVNWYKELLRDVTPLANFNANMSGGSDRVKYFAAFNFVTNPGLYKKTERVSEFTKNAAYTRYNFRTNFDLQITRSLSVKVSLGGTVEDKTNPGKYESTNDVFDFMATVAPNAFPVFVVPGMMGSNSQWKKNPLGEITETGYVSSNGRAAQAAVTVTQGLNVITEGLSISAGIGFNTYYRAFSVRTRDYATYSFGKDETGEAQFVQYNQNGTISPDEKRYVQWRNMIFQGTLNYQRSFGVHDVLATANVNYEDYSISDSALPYKNLIVGGRFNYAYDKRYVAEVSFGYSGNDNFQKGRRFGFFPAGAVAWVLSNEEFLKHNNAVNFLKLRASYGLTGNSEIGGNRFMYNQYYTWGGDYHFGAQNSGNGIYFEGSLANPGVTWEKERKFNVGIEATLFKNVDLTFDYFNNKRYDILAQPYSTVPDYLGVRMPYVNVGKVDNQGFEMTLRYTGKSNKWAYYAAASLSYASNKVVYNAEAPQQYAYRYSTGHPVWQPFALEAIGFFKDQNDIDSSPYQTFTEVQPGDIKYKDQNGDDLIDDNDFYPIGNTSMPKFTLGFNVGLDWKGFDLDLFFQGAFKRTVYFGGKYFHAFQNEGKISEIALGRWTPETASSATYPRLSSTDNQNNYQYSTFWQRNGDFLKLRSAEVGYTLPSELTRKIRIEKIRVYLNGTNLFSIDGMDGLTDPEVMWGYPAMRTISLGLNVQF